MTEWFLVMFIYAKVPDDIHNKYTKEKFIDRVVIPITGIEMQKVCKLDPDRGGLVLTNKTVSFSDNVIVLYCTTKA